MKKTEWIPHFKSAGYCGPAVKVAAGVSVIQLYEEADARGFAVVAGACPVRYPYFFVGALLTFPHLDCWVRWWIHSGRWSFGLEFETRSGSR